MTFLHLTKEQQTQVAEITEIIFRRLDEFNTLISNKRGALAVQCNVYWRPNDYKDIQALYLILELNMNMINHPWEREMIRIPFTEDLQTLEQTLTNHFRSYCLFAKEYGFHPEYERFITADARNTINATKPFQQGECKNE